MKKIDNAIISELKKEFFIHEYSELKESTKKHYIDYLEKIQKIEDKLQLNKNLEEYTKNECIMFLRMCNSSSVGTIYTYLTIIKDYINFINKINKIDYAINEFFNLQRKDLEKCVMEDIIVRSEFYNMISELYNPQDKLILALFYEGVRGDELSEIINLKEENIDLDNKNITFSRYNRFKDISYTTVIHVYDNKFWKIYKESIATELHLSNNGVRKANNKVDNGDIKKPTFQKRDYLFRTGYVIKAKEYIVKQSEKYTGNTELRVELNTLRTNINNCTKKFLNTKLKPSDFYISGLIEKICIEEINRNLGIDILDIKALGIDIVESKLNDFKNISRKEVYEISEKISDGVTKDKVWNLYIKHRVLFLEDILNNLRDI